MNIAEPSKLDNQLRRLRCQQSLHLSWLAPEIEEELPQRNDRCCTILKRFQIGFHARDRGLRISGRGRRLQHSEEALPLAESAVVTVLTRQGHGTVERRLQTEHAAGHIRIRR